MAFRGLARSVAITLFLAGCSGPRAVPVDESDGGLAGSDDSGMVSGGDSSSVKPVEPLAYTAEPPILVYEPPSEPPSRALDPGGVQIAWTPEGFAVLFAERTAGDGPEDLSLRFIDPATLAVSESFVVFHGESIAEHVTSYAMARREDALGVLWGTNDFAVRSRTVGALGEVSTPAMTIAGHKRLVSPLAMVATNEGFVAALETPSDGVVLQWLDGSVRYGTSPVADIGFIEVHAIGSQMPGGGRPAPALRLGALSADAQALAVTWVREDSPSEGDPDLALFAVLRSEGDVSAYPTVVQEANHISAMPIAEYDGEFVLGWIVQSQDTDHLFVARAHRDRSVGVPVRVAVADSVRRPVFERSPGGRIPMLALGGRATSGLGGTEVRFVSIDADAGAVESDLRLNEERSQECDVQELDFDRAGDSPVFGVVWLEQCQDVRRIYFARVTGRR